MALAELCCLLSFRVLHNSLVTIKATYVYPLVGYGNRTALGGDAKNSEEAVRSLRCLSGASYVDLGFKR